MKSFFFHFNKPASQKAGKPQITLHASGKCLVVDNVVCNVPVAGRLRKEQPRFVMAGKAANIVIDQDNVATLS